MLKKAPEKRGIRAKVTRSGFTIKTQTSLTSRGPTPPPPPPIDSKPVGNKFHLYCSTSGVYETEMKRRLPFFTLNVLHFFHKCLGYTHRPLYLIVDFSDIPLFVHCRRKSSVAAGENKVCRSRRENAEHCR